MKDPVRALCEAIVHLVTEREEADAINRVYYNRLRSKKHRTPEEQREYEVLEARMRRVAQIRLETLRLRKRADALMRRWEP